MADKGKESGWEKWLTLGVALVALVLSLLTYWKGEERRKKDVPFEVTAKTYEKYYEMNRIALDKPYLTHLFVTPDRYPEIRKLVEASKGPRSAREKAQYLLEERAVADFIFTYYEQTLYQWDATRDEERKFTSDVLEYLRGRLLRNPRLIYWWQEKHGGLETSYEKKTRDDWQAEVIGKTGMRAWCDPTGPFGDPATAGRPPCLPIQ